VARIAVARIDGVDPSALLFGTDLPGTRTEQPFAEADIDLIIDSLREPLADRVLHENATSWYLRRESRR
jgi:predicted TIM-barrel fold metal-dependent hydrolase